MCLNSQNIQLSIIQNITYLKFPPNSNIYTTDNLYYINTKTFVNTTHTSTKQQGRVFKMHWCVHCSNPCIDRVWSFVEHSTLYANSSMVLPMPKVA